MSCQKVTRSHIRYLEALLAMESEERDRHAIENRTRDAQLPRMKTLEAFDFTQAPQIQVQKEVREALNVADEKPEGTIFLIPLRLDVCTVPDRLSRWQWLDLFSEESEGLLRLLDALRVRAAAIGC